MQQKITLEPKCDKFTIVIYSEPLIEDRMIHFLNNF